MNKTILNRVIKETIAFFLKRILSKRNHTKLKQSFNSKGNHLEFIGPFSSWELASQHSNSWTNQKILMKVEEAIRFVLDGKYPYERDGTTFKELPRTYTLREILSDISKKDVVVDFGGGLGSTYIVNRDLLENEVRQYFVVELENFSIAGKNLAEEYNLPIVFLSSIDDLYQTKVDLVILSCVLQYVENWKNVLKSIIDFAPENIVIDRQPVTNEESYITVQHNGKYYEDDISYPAHYISRDELIDSLIGYVLVENWKSDFDPPDHEGFLFTKLHQKLI